MSLKSSRQRRLSSFDDLGGKTCFGVRKTQSWSNNMTNASVCGFVTCHGDSAGSFVTR
jgi:hypothetical protein